VVAANLAGRSLPSNAVTATPIGPPGPVAKLLAAAVANAQRDDDEALDDVARRVLKRASDMGVSIPFILQHRTA
jgi:hypothetical protein